MSKVNSTLSYIGKDNQVTDSNKNTPGCLMNDCSAICVQHSSNLQIEGLQLFPEKDMHQNDCLQAQDKYKVERARPPRQIWQLRWARRTGCRYSS